MSGDCFPSLFTCTLIFTPASSPRSSTLPSGHTDLAKMDAAETSQSTRKRARSSLSAAATSSSSSSTAAAAVTSRQPARQLKRRRKWTAADEIALRAAEDAESAVNHAETTKSIAELDALLLDADTFDAPDDEDMILNAWSTD